MSIPEFRDASGRRFTLILNYGLAEAIEQALGIDLVNAHNGEALQRLSFDGKLFVQTLAMLCEEQLRAQGTTPAEFVQALDGDALAAAGQALEEMLLVFIRPRMRPIFQELRKLIDEVSQQTSQRVAGPITQQLVRHELERMEERIKTELTRTSSPGSGPASPASAPGLTACGNSAGSRGAATASSGITPLA